MLKRLIPVIALSLVLAGCIQADPPVAGAQNQDIYVVNCVSFEEKPVELVLYCADAGQILNQITWSSWSSTQATGKGVSISNDCEPSCAEGSDVISAVEIRLLKPVTSESGKRVFSQIEMQYDKVQPSGVMDEVLDLPTDVFN
ncbi:MAG: hypothetical protein O3B81_01065 [Actinomycetota bacterium]|nr:hypothetical protein [Actinomycetota bacterium]MDA3027116.1 hypothetical protein [Actinomycetota bacterium]